MKKLLAIVSIAVSGLASYWSGNAAAFLQAPHDSLTCVDCHAYNLNGDAWYDGGNQVFPPVTGRTIDDTLRNFVCLRCHDGQQAGIPGKKLHSSHSFTPGEQSWSTQCVDCHDPHFQGQLVYKGDPNLYLATGTITGIDTSVAGQTIVNFSGGVVKTTGAAAGDWTAKTTAGRGLILVVDKNNPTASHEIIATTASSFTVAGTVSANEYTANVTQFGVIYGQLLKAAVYTGKDADGDGWGDFRDMRFYDSEPGGYIGDRNYDGQVDGVCQVCHTTTVHWANSMATDTHYAANACTECHLPSTGFKKPNVADHSAPPPAGGLSHVTDTPFCVTCHAVDNPMVIHKSNCSSCHVSFDPANIVLQNAANRNYVAVISRGQCTTCHGDFFGNHLYGDGHVNTALRMSDLSATGESCSLCHGQDADASGVVLDSWNELKDIHNVATNGAGACNTCHLSSRADVVAAVTNGRTGTAIGCLSCHGSRANHVAEHNSVGYEDSPTLEDTISSGSVSGQCAGCHDSMGFTNIASGHVGRTITVAEINGASSNGQVIACATCHESPNSTVLNQIMVGKGGALVSCADCHGVRALPHGGHDSSAFAFGGSCNSCHTATDIVGGIHKGNCANCHTAPANGDYTRRAGTNGTAVGATVASTCVDCHASRDTDYQSHVLPAIGHSRVVSTTNATCDSCHTVTTDVVTDVHRSQCALCHTAATGVLKGSAANHTIGGTSNCAQCHTTRVSGHVSEHNATGYDKTPALEDVSLVCAGCHDTMGFANIASGHVGRTIGSASVDPAATGVIACATCHDSTVTAIVNAIAAGKAGTLVACADCHGLRVLPHGGHDASAFASSGSCNSCHTATDIVGGIHKGNCANCHTNPSTGDFSRRAGTNGTAVGKIVTSTCADCHASRDTDYQNHVLPAVGHSRVVSTADNTCDSCHTVASDVVTEVHTSKCVLCHTAVTGVLKGAAVNHTIGGTTNCAQCHTTRVSGHLSEHDVTGYDTTPAQENATLVCANCHDGMGMTNIAAGHVGRTIGSASVDPSASGVIACATCHSSTVTAVVDAIAAGKAGTVVVCADCHGLRTLPHGGHSTGVFGASGNCNTCHTSTDIVNGVHKGHCSDCHTDPAGGDYSLKAGVNGTAVGATTASTCVDCHNITTYVPKTFHHARAEAQAGDCAFCHVNGGAADHTNLVAGYVNCNTCHSGNNGSASGVPVNPAINKIHDACTTCHNTDTSLKTLGQLTRNITIAMPAGTAATNDGGGTCATCHGEYMYNHTNINHTATVALAANCLDCHAGTAGTASTVPTSITDNKVHDGCNVCHNADGTLAGRLATGFDGGTVGGTNGGGDCAVCHFSNFATQPHKVVGHAAMVAGQNDCTACHTATAGDATGVPTSTSNGKVHDNCAACHLANGRLTGSASGKNNGTNGGVDGGGTCGVCHTTYPNNFLTAHVTPNHITRGFVTTAAACVSCHSDADTIVGSRAHKNTCGNCHTTGTGVLRAGSKGVANLGGGDCATCHVGYAGITASGHNSATAHNNRSISWTGTTLVCSNCHSSDTAVVGNAGSGTLASQADVDALHSRNWNGTVMANSCELCHWYQASWANPQGLPTTTDVANYIASGKAGTAVVCTDCHSYNQTGHGGHDNSTFGWSGTCNSCHSGASIVNDVHKAKCTSCHVDPANGNFARRSGTDGTALGAVSTATCTTCHSTTTYPTGGIHHDTSPAANNSCTSCHSAVNHATMVGNSTACTSCHTGTTGTASGAPVSASDSMVHDSCRTCHTFNGQKRGVLVNFTNQKGVNGTGSLPDGGTIGGTNGGGVCTVCHTVASPAAFHHTSNRSAVGQCEYCHTDPRPVSWNTTATPGDNGTASGITRPSQLACIDCHVSFTGGNMIVTKFTRTNYTNLSTDWTRTTQHTIPNSAGRINNYGVCLSCHDGVKAINVSVWHARPDRFGGTAWTFYPNNTASSSTGKTYSRSSCDTTSGDQAHYAAGRSKDTSSGTSPQSLIGGFNIFAPQYGLRDKPSGNAGKNGRCDAASQDMNQYNAKAFDTPAFSRITVPQIAGKNVYTTPQTGTSYAIPVFASLAPNSGATSPAADVISVQSAEWNGSSLVVTATHTVGACSTLTARYGATTAAMSGTSTCSAALSVSYPAGGTTVDVTTSNTSGINVIGYRIVDTSTPIPATAGNDPNMSASANGVTNLDVLANDSGTAIAITGVTQPSFGSVAIAGDSLSINYTGGGSGGSTSFTYTIQGSVGGPATATVNLTVVTNQPPTVGNDTATVNINATTVVNVLANDTDSDGPNALTVSAVGTPSCGSVVNNGGNVSYTAPATAGTCSFSYTAYDGINAVNGTVTMTVTAATPFTPISEGFESIADGTSGPWGTPAWTPGDTGDGSMAQYWWADSGGTPSSSTGPSTGSGSTKYVYLETSSSQASDNNRDYYIESPVVNGAVYNITFSLAWNMNVNTNTNAVLWVEAWDGTAWQNVATVKTGTSGDAWATSTYNLGGYTNSTLKVRVYFRRGTTGSGYHNDVALDNLSFTGTVR